MNSIIRTLSISALGLMLMSCAACSLFSGSEPIPTPEPVQIVPDITPSQGTITMQYEWRYEGRDWEWTLPIPQSLYDYYESRPRASTEDYSIYVTHPEDDSYIETLVGKIDEAAADAGFDQTETVNFAVSFVQSLPYTADSVTTSYDEYPRYPIETLVDNGGDCEDTSILMAALLTEMGYSVILLSFTKHMAAGVAGVEGTSGTYWDHDGGKYYYLESTGERWEIGELPAEYTGESAYIYDIKPTPILTHDWEASTSWFNKLDMTVTVENLGTATAYDVYIYAAFDAGGDMVWNPEESQSFDLAPDQSITISMQLNVPKSEYTRIIVQIVDDGYSADKSYSEWFDT